jgi:hypothetical protein
LFVALSANAQEDAKAPWEEYDKLIKNGEAVSTLGGDLFGDQVNLINGGLSFSSTDATVPGNSQLPVQLTRVFNVTARSDYPAHDFPMADWDLDLPRISGTYAPNWPDARCAVSSPDAAAPPTVKVGENYFYGPDYWQGLQASMSGGGEMLVLQGSSQRPTNGGPYYWMTANRTYFACLSTTKNGSGQGFVALTADGTRYWFDWMAQLHQPRLIG